MEVQVNAECLLSASAAEQIEHFTASELEQLGQALVALLSRFVEVGPNAQRTLELENSFYERLREFACRLLAWFFSKLEAPLEQMPKTVTHQGKPHRKLAEKSRRSNVLTRFGKLNLIRAGYRRSRAGRTIFPLEIVLGIENGCTPAAATRIGKQFAATGSTQGRTLEMVADQMGAKIGTEKLRKTIGTLASGLERFREQAEAEKVLDLIKLARQKGCEPVLSISRDGVSLCTAPWSYFEMASVACVSVLAGGKKLGTVYLGCTPETNQVTLSTQLTSLLEAIVRGCRGCVPSIVYVSDAGAVETAYWKTTLRKFFVDGARIKITRVVDYYHAAERLTKIADALKFGKDKAKRQAWLKHVRGLLLQPGGHGRVLRSIATMRGLYGYNSSGAEDANKAERYLRRYHRFMDYAKMKSLGYPIGSGVVESACKQIVTERMKLSGMRWKKAGGQRTMTLRCLLLSGIWDKVYALWLSSKPTVSDLIKPHTQ